MLKYLPIAHGNIGNKHAVKDVTKSASLTLRCTSKDKARWVKSAEGKKIAQWVTETLNKAVKNKSDADPFFKDKVFTLTCEPKGVS
jgi:hypothetical protein